MSIWLHGLSTLHSVVLHGSGPVDVNRWTWDLSVMLGVLAVVGVYLYGVLMIPRLYSLAERVSLKQVLLFLSGSLIFFLSLASPLDVLGDNYLFSAHMVQHILMAGVVPPLLLLGSPAWLIRPLIKPQAIAGVVRFMTSPIMAFFIFNLNFWLWHSPGLYEAALDNGRVHLFQHLTFVLTGLIGWWPILSPLRELPPISYPLQLLYLFANCQPNVFFGSVFVFARGVIYRAYADAPRVFALSAHTDQQIGGLIMWIPGNIVYLIVLSIVYFRWFNKEEQAGSRKMAIEKE